jgi:hypothetical protein
MSGEAARSTEPEASQIRLTDDYDVLYWTARLYCTASQLRNAIAAVGSREVDVRLYLRETEH